MTSLFASECVPIIQVLKVGRSKGTRLWWYLMKEWQSVGLERRTCAKCGVKNISAKLPILHGVIISKILKLGQAKLIISFVYAPKLRMRGAFYFR